MLVLKLFAIHRISAARLVEAFAKIGLESGMMERGEG